MKKAQTYFYCLLFVIFSVGHLNAQHKMSLQQYEDSILSYFTKILTYKVDSSEREVKNQHIKVVNKQIRTADSVKFFFNKQILAYFDKVLTQRESFDYPFAKLRYVSKLLSDDERVRVITWNLPKQNGEYDYFGYVQRLDKKLKKVKLFKLNDASETIENPETRELGAQNWYGALYYHMRTDNAGKETYYTLLGWDGNNKFTNKKLIECFYFNKNKLVLGPPVFKMGNEIQNRLVFEYAKQAKMMLRNDDKLDLIVYDHLAPSVDKFKGQYMYYGPDLSQDGIKFIDGSWVLKPNLDLRNMQESTGKSIKKSH